MKNNLLLAALLLGLTSFGQNPAGLSLRIIPGSTNPKYQDQVEFKAYLYNKTNAAIRIVNPNHAEPSWRLYRDEWLMLDASGQKRNPRDFMDGADYRFTEKDVTVIAPGDSLYVRYFKFKFEDAGKFTVKYTLDHNPANSTAYKDTKAGRSLTVFRLESNTLSYEIKQSALAEVKTTRLLSEAEVYKEKEYKSIDDAFANAGQVYRLRVGGVKQEDFNKICMLKNLRRLEINGAKIDSFPAAFNDLRLLSLTLDIQRSNDVVMALPASIGKMKELTYLAIKEGGNMKFPDEMGDLSELSYLAINSCNFEKLPESFGNLKKLSAFFIQYNYSLTALPSGLANLTALQMIDISSCKKLTQFPAIYNSLGLSSVSLPDNAITSIPPEIANLKKLNYLVLSNNKLTTLPPQLLDLPAIQLMNVRENAFAKGDDVVRQLQKKLGKSFFL